MALWILAVLATIFFLRASSQLLIPIAIAVLVSYALEPVVVWLKHHGVPRMAGASLCMVAIVGLGAWGAYALRDEAVKAMEALPQAASRLRSLVPAGAAEALQGGGQSSGTSGQDAGGGAQSTGGSGQDAGGTGQDGGSARQNAGGPRGGGGGALGAESLVQQGVGSLFSLAGNTVVVLFLSFFLLISGHHVIRRLVEISGPDEERRRLTITIVTDISEQIQRFLLVRLVTAAVVGVLTWIVLAWMGAEQAAVWGILAGVFNSIPYFGPVIVSGGLLVVGLVQTDLTQGIQMAAAALAITSLEGWLLTPFLMGKAERMSVLAIFLGLLLWTWIWGAWGTILAVPMLVVIKSVADHVDRLKPVGRLMAP